MLSALELLDYFKNQARRVYVGLHGENPDDRLAQDVARFLNERGGQFKDEPSVLHEHLRNDVKPSRPDELQYVALILAHMADRQKRTHRTYVNKPLIEIAHVHHAMWITFTETR